MKLTLEGAFTSSQIEKAKEEVYMCLWEREKERERESVCVCDREWFEISARLFGSKGQFK